MKIVTLKYIRVAVVPDAWRDTPSCRHCEFSADKEGHYHCPTGAEEEEKIGASCTFGEHHYVKVEEC